MTVWIVNPFDNLPREGRRPQRYWLMARAFAEAGHSVVYWTSDFSHATKERREERDVGGERGRREESFEVIQIPTRPYPKNVCWARVRSHRQLARDFERMAMDRIAESSRLDLLVASTPPLGLCAAALRVARARGAKFVCDIQDAWPETFGRLLPRGFRWLGAFLFAPLRRTARRLYREADLVTGVSARYGDLSGRDDFHLSYHGFDATELPPHSTRRRAIPPRRLAYIGNLGEGYGLETAIGAVARRTDLTLDIAGAGPREPHLRRLAQRLGAEGRVRFHGYVSDPELRALLAGCDAGLVPMRDDSWVGLPYKLGDYLSAGLPVLSSLHGECGALLERTGYGRTYAFGSVASFLEALDALPPARVALPDELRAEGIYPAYVRRVMSVCYNN